MKKENKLKYLVIMFSLLFLCSICLAFHLTIYGVLSEQEIQDSYLSAINNECDNSGDGNNNFLINKIAIKKGNGIVSDNKSDLLFFVTGTFGTAILFIQISESYFNKQGHITRIYKRSLVAQKIRLNN